MPNQQDAILTIILVAILANLLVAIGLLVGPRIRARRNQDEERAEINRRVLLRAHLLGGGNGSTMPSPAESGFGSSSAGFDEVTPNIGAERVPAHERPVLSHGAVAGSASTETATATLPIGDDGDPGELGDVGDGDLGGSLLTDAATGFDGPATWAKRMTEENARVQRYGRSATIVLVELGGLDRLAERLGPAAADRLIPPIATTMRRNARSADGLARLSPTRFAALLPDTDEIRAINYVERVSSASDVWLEAAAVSLRLSIGWAEMSVNQPVDPAIQAAERRLNEERHRLRGRDASDVDDDRDVVAAQMRPTRATWSPGRPDPGSFLGSVPEISP
jgi:diguanylate cyclase (GGDEF)-like protein